MSEAPTTKKYPRLTGAALSAAANGRPVDAQLLLECGYAKYATNKKTGELQLSLSEKAFLKALLVANSITPAPERKTSAPPLRPRSYVVKPGKTNGAVVISVGYLREIGGDRDSFLKVVPTAGENGVMELRLILISEEEAAEMKAQAEEADEDAEDTDDAEDGDLDTPDEEGAKASKLFNAVAAAQAAPVPV